MIEIEVGSKEMFNEDTMEFFQSEGSIVKFEHSLKAVRLWESKHKKCFIDSAKNQELSDDEWYDYFKCMVVEGTLLEEHLTASLARELISYIEDPHTATIIRSAAPESNRGGSSGSATTAETIYAAMANANVDFSCENWNLNNLLMTLRIISIQNGPKQKMSRNDIYKHNAMLNKQRRAMAKTRG